MLFCASYLSRKIVDITLSSRPESEKNQRLFGAFFSSSFAWFIPLLLLLAGGVLVMPSFLELVTTGATYEHWSRFIVMSFLFSIALILIVTRVVNYTLDLVAARLAYSEIAEYVMTSSKSIRRLHQ